MSAVKIWFLNEEGEVATVDAGALVVNGTEIPIVDGVAQLPETPFFRQVRAVEWDLIRRYDRGEFDDPAPA